MALDLLFELGMLVADGETGANKTAPIVTTGSEAMSHHLRGYHAQMLRHAADCIVSVDAASRDISSLTCCGGPRTMERLKKELTRVRNELIAWATEEEAADPDRLFQLGFYAVPLSVGEHEG